uniref:CC domain-containing protein n=1 Tax=Rhabditophanes sp. KR3021 TaxID=114890 RepID=A0AC35UDX9_9BILA
MELLFNCALFVLIISINGNLQNYSFGTCISGQCPELLPNSSYSLICHTDDNCYPSMFFDLDSGLSTGPCIAESCPMSNFCFKDGYCYPITMNSCTDLSHCQNGYDCKDAVCVSMFAEENEAIIIDLPPLFQKYFTQEDIISSCLYLPCPENYVCAHPTKFPFCLPQEKIKTFLKIGCNDKLIIGGKNICHKFKKMCNNSSWSILKELCPYTCNKQCLSFGSKTYYSDALDVSGRNLCKKFAEANYCNYPVYQTIIRRACPDSCRRKKIRMPPFFYIFK